MDNKKKIINVTENSNIPAYVKVYNLLYSDITNNVYKENTCLPSETILSKKYGVSRTTLRQALAILHEDGLIIKSQGKDTLVAPKVNIDASDIISNPMIKLSKRKITHITTYYNYGAPTDIARSKLELNKSDIVLACDNVYYSGNMPISYTFTQIPTKMFNEIEADVSKENSIELITTDLIFSYAKKWDFIIKLIKSNKLESELLNIEYDTPLILLEGLLINNQNNNFARCKFYFLPEYYELKFKVSIC